MVQFYREIDPGKKSRCVKLAANVSNVVFSLCFGGFPPMSFSRPATNVIAGQRDDEAWSFCYAKQKNVPTAKAAPEGAGGIWTWVGLDGTLVPAIAGLTKSFGKWRTW